MSYVVGAGTVAFSRGEDRPRGVEVTVGGVAAGRALENPYAQSEAEIGSLAAPGAGHRGVGGRHRHHLPARPLAAVDQFSFAGADRGVGRFAGHVLALAQELRFEVLDRDQRVVLDHGLGPDPGIVSVLPGRLLRDPGGLPLRGQIALRLRLALGPAAAGHLALGPGQFGRAAAAVAEMRQVESRIGGGSGGLHTPVHADTGQVRGRNLGLFAFDDERRVPVTETVTVDTDRRRAGRQFPRPDDRDEHLPGSRRRPPTSLNPLRVYSSDGRASLSRFTFGRPRPLTLNESFKAAP
jgi:hypothetical protein